MICPAITTEYWISSVKVDTLAWFFFSFVIWIWSRERPHVFIIYVSPGVLLQRNQTSASYMFPFFLKRASTAASKYNHLHLGSPLRLYVCVCPHPAPEIALGLLCLPFKKISTCLHMHASDRCWIIHSERRTTCSCIWVMLVVVRGAPVLFPVSGFVQKPKKKPGRHFTGRTRQRRKESRTLCVTDPRERHK